MQTALWKRLLRRSATSGVALSALVGFGILGGCGGSNNGPRVNPTSTPVPTNVPSVDLVGLTSSNTLVFFNSRNPGTVTTRRVSLPAGENLLGIDNRTVRLPAATGPTGIYGLTRLANGTIRLVILDTSGSGAVSASNAGSAGAVTAPATLGGSISIDFNPVPDRLRVISTSGANFRINPDTGGVADADMDASNGVQADGRLTFDTTSNDANAGRTPSLVGAAYTNNDTDAATGTVNYGIDSTLDVLVTQGRADNAATPVDEMVSPNTGRLFTVGSLDIDVPTSTGFDIVTSAGTNTAFITYGSRLATINLATGAATPVGQVGGGSPLIGLTTAPTILIRG